MEASSALNRNIKPRLTQDEKTAETKRRLLDAAILCLVDRGYSNTTTSEIAERAGLSRGAQLYHFPKKEELLTSAVEHLFQLMLSDMKEKIGRVNDDRDRRAAAIDQLWQMCNGQLMTAWLELVGASRTDSFLQSSVRAANDRMTEFLAETFKELFGRSDTESTIYDLVPVMMIFLFEGMALEGGVVDPQLVTRILRALKTVTW